MPINIKFRNNVLSFSTFTAKEDMRDVMAGDIRWTDVSEENAINRVRWMYYRFIEWQTCQKKKKKKGDTYTE